MDLDPLNYCGGLNVCVLPNPNDGIGGGAPPLGGGIMMKLGSLKEQEEGHWLT